MTETMTIEQLIRRLNLIKKLCGNLSVVLSSDSEGNSFGTICNESVGVSDGLLFIMPCRDCVELETIKGYKKEE